MAAACCYSNNTGQGMTTNGSGRTTRCVVDPAMAISKIEYDFTSYFIAAGTFGKVLEVLHRARGDDATDAANRLPVAVKLFSPASFVEPGEVPMLAARLGCLTRAVLGKLGLDEALGKPRATLAEEVPLLQPLYTKYSVKPKFPIIFMMRLGRDLYSAPPVGAERLHMARQLLWTCALLTNSGWLHLDIKPANICRHRAGVSAAIALVDHDAMFCDSAAALELEQPMPPTLSPIGLMANKMPLVPYHPWWARMTSSPVLMTYAMYFSAALTMSGHSNPASQQTLPAVAREYYRVRKLAGQFFAGRFPFPPLEWILDALGGTKDDIAQLAVPATAAEGALWRYLITDGAEQQLNRDAFLHEVAECWLGPSAPGGEWDVEMVD